MNSGRQWAPAVAGLWILPALAVAAQPSPGFLSAAAQGPALAIAHDHLRNHRAALALEEADLESVEIDSRHRSRESGVETFFFRQKLHGLEVVGAELSVSVDSQGRVLSRWSRGLRGLAARAPRATPTLSAAEAVSRAANHLALKRIAAGSLGHRGPASGADRAHEFLEPSLSLDPIPTRLRYLATQPTRANTYPAPIALTWNLVLRPPGGRHWWDVYVDANSGEVLDVRDWVDHDAYRVFPLPQSDPVPGDRSLESDPADPIGSPFGWHDTDGVAGAEFDITRGNNVYAREDLDGDNQNGSSPSDPGLVFDFPLDLSEEPVVSLSAAITQLFYLNNIAHDWFYAVGFDEQAGNFQENNYGRGGLGGDAVLAEAQDSAGTNNANFGTPPDGSSPIMQMFLWTRGKGQVELHSPPEIAGLLKAGTASFGPPLDSVGVTGEVAAALDPDPPGSSTTDACSALSNPAAISGRIALVDRGGCNFTVKVKNSQDAGAIAVIVANHTGDSTPTLSGNDPSLTIPSVSVGQSDGAAIRGALGSGVQATLRALPARDSALSNDIIVHEYAHGVSNRLVGGKSNVNCLDGFEGAGLGEGWSDFFDLAFTSKPGDLATDLRRISPYLAFDPDGLRNFPYTTIPFYNPLTYEDIENMSGPHDVGEVWAITLWEAYWNFVAAYGFDSDPSGGSAGNARMIRRVVEALSLTPCDPGFLEARDALLSADLAATGGTDACLLWDAFARRGLGQNAYQENVVDFDVTEDFSVPAECEAYCGDATAQAPEQCDDGNRLDFDGCHSSCHLEDRLSLAGTASGGSVSFELEGEFIEVTTSAGQSAQEVLQALATAIENHPTLGALGISARANGGVLETGGSLRGTSIDDPGLVSPAVPALPWLPGVFGAAALAATARRRLR